MRARNLIILIVACTCTAVSAATAGTIHRGDRVRHWSSAERRLDLLNDTFLRVQRRNGERVFAVVPINLKALMLGIAY
jgi:hypothetical protein